MDDFQLAKAIKAFDEATLEFKNDHRVIFGSESSRLKFGYGFAASAMKSWKSSKKCIYSGCDKLSINRSHTIQKSGPLSLIAEKGQLLQPFFGSDGRLKMVPVGLRNASIFPGFCRDHEELFSCFEKNKSFESERDILLQCFRTVCRELVRLDFEVTQFSKLKNEYVNYRNGFIASKVSTPDNIVNNENISFNSDPVEMSYSGKIEENLELIEHISEGIYHELTGSLERDHVSFDVVHIKFPDILPLCLSGLGTFKMELNGNVDQAVVFYCVTPSKTGSEIIIATNKSKHKMLLNYVGNYMSGRFDVLAAIESWMVFQTDHWFISPSTWGALSEEKRQLLIGLIEKDHQTLGFECPFSIFDDVRSEMINEFENSEEFDSDAGRARETLSKEKGRLHFLGY